MASYFRPDRRGFHNPCRSPGTNKIPPLDATSSAQSIRYWDAQFTSQTCVSEVDDTVRLVGSIQAVGTRERKSLSFQPAYLVVNNHTLWVWSIPSFRLYPLPMLWMGLWGLISSLGCECATIPCKCRRTNRGLSKAPFICNHKWGVYFGSPAFRLPSRKNSLFDIHRRRPRLSDI